MWKIKWESLLHTISSLQLSYFKSNACIQLPLIHSQWKLNGASVLKILLYSMNAQHSIEVLNTFI